MLKFAGQMAEPTYMIRGGSWFRRRAQTLILAVTAAIVVLPLSPTQNAVAAAPSSVDVTAGEAGSGPGPIPERLPERTLRSGPKVKWSDLSASSVWARAAINLVGGTNTWMRDFPANADGTYPFRPRALETRRYFARAVASAFAPDAVVDSSITFADLDPTDPFYRWANIAIDQGWMRRTTDGRFLPDMPVTMTTVHRVLVRALGMASTAKELDRLHTNDGVKFSTPANFGTTLLGMRLGLRYNSSDEGQDVGPTSRLNRAQVAYSLAKASTLAPGDVTWIADQYDGIVLPKMGPSRLDIVRWGIRFVGYPYVWGGEWGLGSPEPIGLGGQPVAGFDCSGWTWWALRANDGGVWKVSPPRPYGGWTLPQRTSADMARFGALKYGDLHPGDLMFYDGNGDHTVDHVDVYVGNGYALDSSNTPGGVTIMWVGDGWYREHFVHGRRVVPMAGS